MQEVCCQGTRTPHEPTGSSSPLALPRPLAYTLSRIGKPFLASPRASQLDSSHAVNVATALHRLAVINKRRRAGRDALLRDARFEKLVGAVAEHAADFNARAVADVLWSFATLQHWPPTLLTPVLTSVSVQLEADSFQAQHLSTMVWALAKLECKPVRLLEQMEAQAVTTAISPRALPPALPSARGLLAR